MRKAVKAVLTPIVLILIGIGLLMHQSALGQAASAPVVIKGCDPNALPVAGVRVPLPWGKGSDLVEVATDKAEGLFVWCRQSGGGWNVDVWQWNLLGVRPAGNWDLNAAQKRVRAASEPASAIAAEFKSASVPLVGDQQVFEYWRLRHVACVKMTTFPLPVNLPAPHLPFKTGDFPARPDGSPWCGPAPTPPAPPPPPPPPPVERWTVAKSSTSTYRTAYVKDANTRGAADGFAKIGEPCDATALISIQVGPVIVNYGVIAPAALVNTTKPGPHVSVCVRAP